MRLRNAATARAGTLTRDGASRSVRIQAVRVHKDARRAQWAWRELILLQQLSETMGDKIVRVLGYVEHPGQSLHFVLEDTAGSALDLMHAGQMTVQEAVRAPHARL